MDLFDVHRRDVLNFDSYMDLKNPGFGGDASLVYDRDAKGKKNKIAQSENKLKDYRRVVERDPLFKSQHYDSTYKAMTNDLVYKQEGKKPTTYADPYLTGIPIVEVGEYEVDESVKTSFESFINEDIKLTGSVKTVVELNNNVKKSLDNDANKLAKLKKERNSLLTEGKCTSFNQFNSVSEHWYDEYETEVLDPEPEVAEPEVDTEIDTDEGPENPPRRRNNPNPKNRKGYTDEYRDLSIENAVEDLMKYMNISKEDASKILAVDAINSLDNDFDVEPTETEIMKPDIEIDTIEGPENPPRRRNNPNPKNRKSKFSRKSNDLSSLGDLLSFGEGPDGESCYGEGPSC